jgi:hypothetical protein
LAVDAVEVTGKTLKGRGSWSGALVSHRDHGTKRSENTGESTNDIPGMPEPGYGMTTSSHVSEQHPKPKRVATSESACGLGELRKGPRPLVLR